MVDIKTNPMKYDRALEPVTYCTQYFHVFSCLDVRLSLLWDQRRIL